MVSFVVPVLTALPAAALLPVAANSIGLRRYDYGYYNCYGIPGRDGGRVLYLLHGILRLRIVKKIKLFYNAHFLSCILLRNQSSIII